MIGISSILCFIFLRYFYCSTFFEKWVEPQSKSSALRLLACLPAVGEVPHIEVNDSLAFIASQHYNEPALVLHHQNGVPATLLLNGLQDRLVVLHIAAAALVVLNHANLVDSVAVENDALHQSVGDGVFREHLVERIGVSLHVRLHRTRANHTRSNQGPQSNQPTVFGFLKLSRHCVLRAVSLILKLCHLFPPCAFARPLVDSYLAEMESYTGFLFLIIPYLHKICNL